jgi:hypothetical protein
MKKFTDKNLYDSTLLLEELAIKTICIIWNCDYINTSKHDNRFSKIDGLFIRDNTIKGIYEVKTRTQTYSWFKDYKSIIISYDKITDGAIVSKIMNAPFFAIFRTSCKRILVFQITDNNGRVICPMNVRYTETQKSSTFDKGLDNKKVSTNAYLMLEDNPNLFIFNEEQYESRVLEKYGSNDK